MATLKEANNVELPRPVSLQNKRHISGPGLNGFTAYFGNTFPQPNFLESDLGTTALYELPPPSTHSKRQLLIVHGVNTPALGMLPFARELQIRDPNTHVVLFDLWGHGLSSTPLVSHTPQIFHSQILQVLAHLKWSETNLIGFSFGGVTVASFAVYNPHVPTSIVLVAPAGLLSRSDLRQELNTLLDAKGKEEEAIESLLNWLGAGPAILPDQWQMQLDTIQIFAKALKQWELDEHQGYRHSVLSMLRDGGVFGSEEIFRRFAQLPIPKTVVLGEKDDVCNKSQLTDVGVQNIEVLGDADHELVRVRAGDVADLVHQFWQKT